MNRRAGLVAGCVAAALIGIPIAVMTISDGRRSPPAGAVVPVQAGAPPPAQAIPSAPTGERPAVRPIDLSVPLAGKIHTALRLPANATLTDAAPSRVDPTWICGRATVAGGQRRFVYADAAALAALDNGNSDFEPLWVQFCRR